MFTLVTPNPRTRGTWPVCARCRKLVDGVDANPVRGGYKFIARCHGGVEEVFVGNDVLESFDGSITLGGEAFSTYHAPYGRRAR